MYPNMVGAPMHETVEGWGGPMVQFSPRRMLDPYVLAAFQMKYCKRAHITGETGDPDFNPTVWGGFGHWGVPRNVVNPFPRGNVSFSSSENIKYHKVSSFFRQIVSFFTKIL